MSLGRSDVWHWIRNGRLTQKCFVGFVDLLLFACVFLSSKQIEIFPYRCVTEAYGCVQVLDKRIMMLMDAYGYLDACACIWTHMEANEYKRMHMDAHEGITEMHISFPTKDKLLHVAECSSPCPLRQPHTGPPCPLRQPHRRSRCVCKASSAGCTASQESSGVALFAKSTEVADLLVAKPR